jgi:ribosomal protein S18 acetylase RimI-like enzyme
VSSFVRVAGTSSPLGIVSARKQPDRFMGFEVGILSWIYVDPLARGRGIADALMEATGAWMNEQGVEGRQVYVTIGNEAAVSLYRRHGYKAADYRMLAR